MAGFLSGFRKKPRPESYNLWRLVDARYGQDNDGSQAASREQIICDIDKTYLETEFESLVKMAKIAFEAADAKITVEGASEVLLAARWGKLEGPVEPERYPRPLHFVSSSPPQLRRVLAEKLSMDGLDWSSDTFKNQAYNLRKGRFAELKQQIAYKSAAILSVLARAEAGTRFYLIGDNAESDAVIYLGVKLYCEGLLSSAAYHDYLVAAGVSPSVASDLVARFSPAPQIEVAAILIRKLANYVFESHPELGVGIILFENFYEAALILTHLGLIDSDCLWPLTRKFHNSYHLSRHALLALLAHAATWPDTSGQLAGLYAATAQRLRHPEGIQTELPKIRSDYAPSPARAFERLSEANIITGLSEWLGRLEHVRSEPR